MAGKPCLSPEPGGTFKDAGNQDQRPQSRDQFTPHQQGSLKQNVSPVTVSALGSARDQVHTQIMQ